MGSEALNPRLGGEPAEGFKRAEGTASVGLWRGLNFLIFPVPVPKEGQETTVKDTRQGPSP